MRLSESQKYKIKEYWCDNCERREVIITKTDKRIIKQCRVCGHIEYDIPNRSGRPLGHLNLGTKIKNIRSGKT